MNKIADSILAFEKNGVTYFNGNYEEYCRFKEKQDEELIEEKVSNKVKNVNNQYLQSKEARNRKNKINKLEVEIEAKENEIKNLKEEMQSEEICTDYIKLKELQDKVEILEKELEEKMTEWEKLCE